MISLEARVVGIPRPQGTHRVSRSAHIYEQHSKTHREYRRAIVEAVQQAMSDLGHDVKVDGPLFPAGVPVYVSLHFFFAMPQAERRATDAEWSHRSARPDGDKLQRSVLDALSEARVWHDDSQMSSWSGSKANWRYEPTTKLWLTDTWGGGDAGEA